MKQIYLKSKRAIRFLFYSNLNIFQQMDISNTLQDDNLEKLFWKMSKADREHSLEVFKRTRLHSNDKLLLKLSLLHDIGKSINDYPWIFRIFTELGVIRSNKSNEYLAHEEIGKEILIKNNCPSDLVKFYETNLLVEKHEILENTDF